MSKYNTTASIKQAIIIAAAIGRNSTAIKTKNIKYKVVSRPKYSVGNSTKNKKRIIPIINSVIFSLSPLFN